MIQSPPRLQRTLSAPGIAPRPVAFRDDTWVGTARAEQPARAAKPPRLLMAPDAEDPPALRALVQQGPPHRLAEAIKDITGGVAFTAAGLAALYQRAASELQWQVRKIEARQGGVAFSLEATVLRRRWYQRRPSLKPVYRCEKLLMRHRGGALELHASDMFLHPRLRGRGLVVRCEAMEAQLLRALSSHPDTRLSLAGGYAINPFKARRPWEFGGYYLHGAHHYLLADDAGVAFPTGLYGWGHRPPDRQQLHGFFRRWLRRAYREGTLRQVSGSVAFPSLLSVLLARVDACRTPHDFAMLRMPGVAVRGDRAIGKACLTSGSAPAWAGARFVNPAPPGSPQARLRERSRWGFAARTLQELSRAAPPGP